MVVFMGLFFGVIGGIAIVFAREFMDQSFLDIEDAKHNLPLPILGAISRITTPEEIAKEKQRTITFAVSGLILAIVLITTTALISFLKGR